MSITNRTENFSDEKLEKLIKFCCPRVHLKKLCDIWVKNCKQPYDCDYRYGNYTKPKIILRFTKNEKDWFPLSFKLRSDKVARTGYFHGEYCFPTLDAAAVFLTSHEIAHDLQHSDPVMKFWLYHDLKSAEQHADKLAFKRLRKFLKLQESGKIR